MGIVNRIFGFFRPSQRETPQTRGLSAQSGGYRESSRVSQTEAEQTKALWVEPKSAKGDSNETQLIFLVAGANPSVSVKVDGAIDQFNRAHGLAVRGTLHIARDGSFITVHVPTNDKQKAMSLGTDLKRYLETWGLDLQ